MEVTSKDTQAVGTPRGRVGSAASERGRVAELVTVGLLGSFLVARLVSRSSAGRW